MVKFALSVFNVYRVMDMAGQPKLSTITQPNTGDLKVLPELFGYIGPFLEVFVWSRLPRDGMKQIFQKASRIFPIYKSAPGMIKDQLPVGGISNYSSHPVNLISQLRALFHSGTLVFIEEINEFVNNITLKYVIDSVRPLLQGPVRSTLGKLSVKEEAAGKVRVFAIVDSWTQ
jgi:hypothetical protein